MKNWILGILLALAPAAAFAEEIYKCDMKRESRFGWISNVVVIAPRVEEAFVVVYDAYIKEIYGEPRVAKISYQSDHMLRFSWTVEGIELSNAKRRVTASYSGSFNRKTGMLRLMVYLPGMDMTPPRGSGTCALLDKKK